jgi:hypothetical protein
MYRMASKSRNSSKFSSIARSLSIRFSSSVKAALVGPVFCKAVDAVCALNCEALDASSIAARMPADLLMVRLTDRRRSREEFRKFLNRVEILDQFEVSDHIHLFKQRQVFRKAVIRHFL